MSLTYLHIQTIAVAAIAIINSNAYVITYHSIWNIRRNFLRSNIFACQSEGTIHLDALFLFCRSHTISWRKQKLFATQSNWTKETTYFVFESDGYVRNLIRNAFKLIRKMNLQLWAKFVFAFKSTTNTTENWLNQRLIVSESYLISMHTLIHRYFRNSAAKFCHTKTYQVRFYMETRPQRCKNKRRRKQTNQIKIKSAKSPKFRFRKWKLEK